MTRGPSEVGHDDGFAAAGDDAAYGGEGGAKAGFFGFGDDGVFYGDVVVDAEEDGFVVDWVDIVYGAFVF